VAQRQRNISVKTWAWTLSILFHVVLLATFAFIKFSAGTRTSSNLAAPVTSIETITAITNLSPTVPKPKIKEPSGELDRASSNIMPPLPSVPKHPFLHQLSSSSDKPRTAARSAMSSTVPVRCRGCSHKYATTSSGPSRASNRISTSTSSSFAATNLSNPAVAA